MIRENTEKEEICQIYMIYPKLEMPFYSAPIRLSCLIVRVRRTEPIQTLPLRLFKELRDRLLNCLALLLLWSLESACAVTVLTTPSKSSSVCASTSPGLRRRTKVVV